MARKDFEGGQLTCSFCGKSQREVRKLIAGPTVYICDECIRLCTDIVLEDVGDEGHDEQPGKLPTPQELTAFLDEYVVGQDHAKKVLSVAVYNHYKRINNPKENSSVELAKSNVLMIGPTGTGKTLLAETLARKLKVPFTIADATTLTEAGYVGEDVENIVSNLLIAADNDVERAQRGIIYIDEIDKIATKGESLSMTRDVSGEGVQQALLKVIEGTKANVAPRGAKKYGQAEMVQVDTRDILVICGGSFTGLEQVIERRLGDSGLGFGANLVGKKDRNIGDVLRDARPEDLNAYGLIPEFVGRLPVMVTLDALTESDLREIVFKPKNALIKQYQKLFEIEGVKLVFDEAAIASVAEAVVKNASGARGLRSILETVMLDIMYEVPFMEGLDTCRITEAVIKGGGKPELIFTKKKSA